MSGPSVSDLAVLLRSGDRTTVIGVLLELEAGTAELDAATVAVCVELLAEPVKEVSRRAAGVLVRAAGSGDLRPPVIDALGDVDPRTRWGAAFALAGAGVRDEPVLAAAVDALALEDGDVRWAAAEIVRETVRAHPGMIAVVSAAAAGEMSVQRKMALYCLRDLRRVPGADDCGVFLAALDDEDRGVRLAGLSCLAVSAGVGAHGSALDRVIGCLESDPDAGVRRAAAATLGKLRTLGPRAIDALERARDVADDPGLARAAAAALR